MDIVNAPWKLLLARGLVGIVFGVVAMAWPVGTTAALAVLWGVWALADGIGLAVQGWRFGGRLDRVVVTLVALLSLAAGLYAVLRPGATAVTLTWVLGVWLVVRAAVGVVTAMSTRMEGSVRAVLLLSSVVDLALGLLFMANPGRGAVGIALVLGLVAVIWGATLVFAALVVRSQDDDLVGSA